MAESLYKIAEWGSTCNLMSLQAVFCLYQSNMVVIMESSVLTVGKISASNGGLEPGN